VNPLRSVGARLSLGLAVVVACALALVYLVVVPSLQRRLVDARLRQLERVAPALARSYDPTDPDFVANADEAANARAVLFQPLSASPPALQVLDDSRAGGSSADVEDDRLALAAARTVRPQHGTVERGETHYAEVAVPVSTEGSVLLLSSSLHDAYADVALVRRRLVLAGLLALALSAVLGLIAASMFARRIRRLERAADRIAGGDFGVAVVDRSGDEVGQLATAFEHMRQRLAQLDRVRSDFIANASHELRTPIFALGGFLELLTDEELDEATREEFLATMREQVERLTKLATDLLDLSRLDTGRLHVAAEPVDLAEHASSLVEEFRAVAQARAHELDALADEAPPALCDAERTRQIASILLENALLHTPAGTTVRLVTGARGGRPLLAVEDDGPGIPAEARERVFDRFQRADDTLASGSGLGLAIARELAALMGGAVELETGAGRTVFSLVLPAAAAVGGRTAAPA
jgi:signal transduction histidine kinase